tara:strand:- start:291 stop:1610 length:1320 start_codon:yes stop_codon:yes gene_type:complete
MESTCNTPNKNILYLLRPGLSGLFLFYKFCLSFVFGFDFKPNVSEIKILGLSKTKQHIIEREIYHKPNFPIDSSLAELDRNRIFNLGLFDEVSWSVIPIESGDAILQFNLIESLYRLPPLILPVYDEEKGWSLRGLYIIKNFQGKNRNIELDLSIGGEDRIQFSLSDPWVFGNRVSLFMYAEKSSYRHLFLDRITNTNLLRLELGKWYGDRIKLKFSPTTTKSSYTNKLDTLNYKYFIPEIKIEYDSRDIFWNPKKGIRLINKFIPMVGENEFFVWNQSYSVYLPLFNLDSDLTLAANASIRNKWGYKNDIWLSYFGNSFNVRGWELPDVDKNSLVNQSYRFGHEYIFSSIEIRKLIIPKHHSRLGLLNGLSIIGFFDSGFISDHWSKIKENKMIGGAGIGIRIPIPMLESIRIDLGWGLKDKTFRKKPVLHFAIKQKF